MMLNSYTGSLHWVQIHLEFQTFQGYLIYFFPSGNVSNSDMHLQ